MSITVALYSHDSVGLGHARRNRALAYALNADLPRITGQKVRGILIAGHQDATADSLPAGWDWLVLPGFARTSDGYTSRHLDVSTERLWHLRSSTAAAALEAMNPDLFIVDRHPFGVDDELLPALEVLRGMGTRCVLGMREVLDSPEVAHNEWRRIGGPEAVCRYYHAVWIYGDPSVYDPVRTGEIPSHLAEQISFTGYLSHGRPDDAPTDSSVHLDSPYVITMLGGGSDGNAIALAAAQSQVPPGHQHLIITGPQMSPDHYQRVLAAANSSDHPAGTVEVTRFIPDVPTLVRGAAAVVSMGGYNSLTEIMATTTPALIIPRNSRRQEQLRRAQALAAVDAVDTLHPQDLSPTALSQWFHQAAERQVNRDAVDLDGLTRIGEMAAAQIATRTPSPYDTGAITVTERSIPRAH